MHLFISDLHLQEERPALSRAFFRFLEEQAPTAEALYILGDFFELWVGDDAMTPFQQQVAAALKQLANQGIPVYLMHGNRDFMIGKQFCQLAGCTLLPDPCLVQLYGEPILLMHGDLLCTRDLAYQRMRRLFHNPVINFVLHHLPLSLRWKIAGTARQSSLKNTPHKQKEIMDVTPEAVVATMQQYQVAKLIHGHTHRPAVHSLQLELKGQSVEALRLVLGDWSDTQGWMIEVDERGCHLSSFSF